MRVSSPRPAPSLLGAFLLCTPVLLACPSEVQKAAVAADAGKVATASDDERVVNVGGDLYSKEAASNPSDEPEVGQPGSGRPDETNGACRLYAPKLPEPACCKFETGFDAEAAMRICGHDVYLGESIRMSCGYFFTDDQLNGHPSFRASMTGDDTPKLAAEREAEQLNFQLRKRDIKAEPVEGVRGAYMLRNKNFRWAFLPGWSSVRKVSWIEESCADDKVNELLKVIAQAKQPAATDTKPMLPVARPQ